MSTTTSNTAPAVSVETNNESKHFFYDENLSTALTAGIQETLNEMCRLPCDFEDSFIAQNWIPVGQATGAIQLITGNQTGLLQLHFSDVAVLTIMAKLLGRTPSQVNDEALDCVAALTGIVYGRMKAILNPIGYKFMMAIPKMNYTNQLARPEGEFRHLIIPFKVASSKCFVQVLIKPDIL